MLVELAVTNLGVIEAARIPFSGGLVALTGETGAGKTMLVEALDLLMGGRAEPTRVREGQAEAVVEGLFAVDDDEWVIRRVVPAVGRSRCYVNGQLSTAATLAELGTSLLEMHGQHAQQALRNPRAQRDALDEFLGLDTTRLDDARQLVRAIDRQLRGTEGDERTRAREIDLLRFQLDEIEAVGPVQGEEVELEAEEDRLADALAHREAAGTAVSLLTDDGAAADLLARAIAALSGRRPFEEHSSRLVDLSAELSDCAHEIRAVGESIEPDESRLDTVRRRRQQLIELRRKYGDSTAEVLEFANDAAVRLEELTSHDATRARVAAELATARADLDAESRRLGSLRRDGASSLAEAIEEQLQSLAMPSARIEVSVSDTEELPGAGQSVEIRISANQGMAVGPLNKVASGGELSRVMLSLRLVLSHGPPTMVFDEVDAGIGGETASAVGRALAELGTTRQVLVVTHLPQVAAFADSQILVSKSTTDDGVVTRTTDLDSHGRVVELSRMLSGSPDSTTAREHASELLAIASARRECPAE